MILKTMIFKVKEGTTENGSKISTLEVVKRSYQ